MRFKITIFILGLLTISNPLFGNEFDKDIKNKELPKFESNIEKNYELDTSYFDKLPSNDYILGPGDKILINVSREYPELTSIVSITGEGTINIPMVGRIFVDKLTLSELTFLLNEKYKEYVKYPSLEINIIGYRQIKVLIDGEVNNPGIYSLKGQFGMISESNLSDYANTDSINKPGFTRNNQKLSRNVESNAFPTVIDAIRNSGGITRDSDLSKIKIIRKESISSGEGLIMATLNLGKNILEIDPAENIRIYDGDKIFVSKIKGGGNKQIINAVKSNLTPKYIKVYVTGRVRLPGLITLNNSTTLNDAIDVAGGTTPIKGPVTYISTDSDGLVIKKSFRYRKNSKRGSKKNPYLKEGDLVFVGTSLFSNISEVISEITNPFQGLYSTYQLYDILRDI